jgi:uncharacterized membrane protein
MVSLPSLTIIGTAIFIVLIGVLQLRQDNRLSEKSFVELIKLVIEQLPLIGNVVKQLTSKGE